jgi:hypothetical protein
VRPVPSSVPQSRPVPNGFDQVVLGHITGPYSGDMRHQSSNALEECRIGTLHQVPRQRSCAARGVEPTLRLHEARHRRRPPGLGLNLGIAPFG